MSTLQAGQIVRTSVRLPDGQPALTLEPLSGCPQGSKGRKYVRYPNSFKGGLAGVKVHAEALAFVLRFEADAAYELAWGSPEPGKVTWRVEDGKIYAEPVSHLTGEDIAFLKAHRWQILQILEYLAPDIAQDGRNQALAATDSTNGQRA